MESMIDSQTGKTCDRGRTGQHTKLLYCVAYLS